MTANNKNVPAGVIVPNNHGVSWLTKYVPTHNVNPAMDIAIPRTFVGYISDNNTHTTALIETAVQNTYNKKKISINMLERPNDSPNEK